jgi:diacylglycerol diphosphate phosphatase/phosphatidate phosphatase
MLVFPIFLRHRHKFHLLHVTLLGFVQVFVLNGFLTNMFKLWIGNMRPDFLARCQPAAGTPVDKFVTAAVCTTKSTRILYDGFKSTPSGHASNSFAGQVYFAMFLAGQLAAFKPGSAAYKVLICLG